MDEESEDLQGREGQYLPPLHRIKMPETKTASAKIRWLNRQGYRTKDIAKGLNIRYQQVRNIITTQPKRAMREDLPPDGIELAPMEDIVDQLLGDELERTHLEARKEEKREQRAKARHQRELEEAEVELDHEDYHQA